MMIAERRDLKVPICGQSQVFWTRSVGLDFAGTPLRSATRVALVQDISVSVEYSSLVQFYRSSVNNPVRRIGEAVVGADEVVAPSARETIHCWRSSQNDRPYCKQYEEHLGQHLEFVTSLVCYNYLNRPCSLFCSFLRCRVFRVETTDCYETQLQT
jgi:hypothetical protein